MPRRKPLAREEPSVANPPPAARYCRPASVNLHPGDMVGYQGRAFAALGTLDYQLAGRRLRLACLSAPDQIRYLELAGNDLPDRLLLLAEIPVLDITTPPPATIYHGGESFLLKLAGAAAVAITGSVPGRAPGACSVWRYRAAGDRWLQIEAWPDVIRMLEGATVHRSMLEMRPATP